MPSVSSYYLLFALCFIFWIFLNTVSIPNKNVKADEKQDKPPVGFSFSVDNFFDWITPTGSTSISYVLCIFIGAILFDSVSKSKIKQYLFTSHTTNAKKTKKLQEEIIRLKIDNDGLINLLQQYKIEKKLIVHYLTNNLTIIKKLKHELSKAKSEIDVLKCRSTTNSRGFENYNVDYCNRSETNYMTSKCIIDNYFHYHNRDHVSMKNNKSKPSQFSEGIPTSVSFGEAAKCDKNIDILSTDELEKLKLLKSDTEDDISHFEAYKKLASILSETNAD